MISLLKTILSKTLFLILGIALLVFGGILIKKSFTYKNDSRYVERRGEKDFLRYGFVIILAGGGAVLYSFSKKKDGNNEAIKLTGNKLNNRPEVNVELENFKIVPLLQDSIYKCIKTSIVYHGETKDLHINLKDEADYDRISTAEKINICGELRDDVYYLGIDNARLIHGASTSLNL